MIQRGEGTPNKGSSALSGRAIAVAVFGGLTAGGVACVLLAKFMPRPAPSGSAKGVAAAVRPVASVPASVPGVVPPVAGSSVPAANPMLLTAGTEAVPVLAFREVGANKRDWADVSATEFDGQLRDLQKAGAHPVSIQDFYAHFSAGKPLPARPILLTFDGCTAGQIANALPALERCHFPAAFFAPTDAVEQADLNTAGWETLRRAVKSGLITVGSHTASNPPNLTNLADDAIFTELTQSRKVLEDRLGVPVHFLTYPNGHGDARTAKAALDAGYLAALTMDRGWAASPAQSYFLPRFAPPRLPEILSAWSKQAEIAPPLPRYLATKNPPLTRGEFQSGRITVQWVAGGDLGTESLHKRETVGIMAQGAKAQAALNGAFFSEIRLRTLGSAMMGPTLCRADNLYSPATLDEDARLEGRPLVLIGPQKCLVLPYAEHLGHSRDILQALMPDVTDAFLAGGWIVHHGRAVAPDILTAWSSHDVNDARHRVFAGIDAQNRFILGGTQDGISTENLSKILEKMKLEEAWLMDSGYSSALVWQNKILISGRNDRAAPSRPVPHALFLYGDPAADALPPPADALPASGPGAATTAEAFAADMGRGHGRKRGLRGTRRHHRRRAKRASASPSAPSEPSAPAPPPAPASPQ